MSTNAREQVAACLDRISAVDPLVNAVCTLDPTAAEQAAARDAESEQGRSRGPLHGTPILVKDNVDTAALTTTAGSLALSELGGAEPPARDAELVRRLRAAGLVVLGKTNLSEWANFRDEDSTTGWSGYGGLTRNPYALNRSAGGSSSGSGSAVAAGFAPVAVGTETDGSITCPAAYNGCVGIKPTVGTVSTRGVVPISSSQDAPGPMAPTVAAAAALLSVLSGDGIDYSAHADTSDAAGGHRLAGKRIGVARGSWWGYSRHADDAAETALGLLAAAGAEIVEVGDLGGLDWFGWHDELLVMKAEFATALPAYLATRSGSHPRTLAELIEFNSAHAERELAFFGQSVLESALAGPGVESREYAASRARCLQAARTDGIDKAVAAHRLDAIFTPSYPPARPIDLVNPERTGGACTQPTAMAGYPIVTVPARLALGLPVAVSFWAGADSETTLIEVAAGFEAVRDAAWGPLPAPTFPEFV